MGLMNKREKKRKMWEDGDRKREKVGGKQRGKENTLRKNKGIIEM